MLINEVVRLSGLSKDGVRHYETLGLIRSTPKQAGSRTYRDYAPDVIETIEHVRRAQQLGLSLKEIGPILDVFFQNPPTQEQTVDFLKERLAVIREKLAQLRTIEAFIVAKLERYDGDYAARASSDVEERDRAKATRRGEDGQALDPKRRPSAF